MELINVLFFPMGGGEWVRSSAIRAGAIAEISLADSLMMKISQLFGA